ncbi:MAG: tetratricopeptide repeat protein [Anaerolineaceae bacterium]
MTNESATFQTLMSKGHAAAWEQDWSLAAGYYQQALVEIPDHPVALSSLGLANFQLREYDDALRQYQRCAAISTTDPMPLEKSALIYERMGRQPEAVKAYMQGAEMQLKMHDVDRAIDDFKNAIRLNPANLTVHTRLAMVFDKMGRKDDAVTEYLVTAALMQKKGDLQKAHQVVQYTLGLSPRNEDARKAFSLLNEQKSLAAFEQSAVLANTPFEEHVEAAEEEPVQEPMPLYDPITETRLKALKQMAGYLFEQNEDNPANPQGGQRAINTLARGADSLSPEQAKKTRVQLHLSQAIDYQTSGQDDLAAVELESAMDLGLDQPAASYVLGLILRTRSPQKALKHLERSAKVPGYELASYLLIADTMASVAEFKEASASALKALKIADIEAVPVDQAEELGQLYEPIFEGHSHITSENDLKYLYEVIIKQLERPDWREYIKAARKQLPAQPEGSPPLPLAELMLETSNSQVVESLGQIRKLGAEGHYRTAMEEAYHALSFAPTYLPLHIQMGDLLISEGRTTEAVEKFLLVANLYNLRGDTAQAIRLLQRISKLAPMDASIRRSLVELFKTSGRVDEAIQELTDLANVSYLMADLENTRRTYEEALALSKNASAPRQWVVKILTKMADLDLQSLDFKSAIRIFEQIRSLQPQEIGPRISLIDLHYRLGQPDKAMGEIEDYLKILETARQPEKAARFWDEVMKDRPENTAIQKRMISYYASHNALAKAIEKLDGLAERLLGEGNKDASLGAIQSIIDLRPANIEDYRRLYDQLKASA